jgi:hypothetical protein
MLALCSIITPLPLNDNVTTSRTGPELQRYLRQNSAFSVDKAEDIEKCELYIRDLTAEAEGKIFQQTSNRNCVDI